MTPALWPLRLVPRRSPSFLTGLGISGAALAVAVAARLIILGVDKGLGFSVTYFPALIVTTIFAGPRWGWASLAAAVGLHLISPNGFIAASDYLGLLALFLISGAATLIVSAAFRNALLRLEDAAAAQVAVQRTLEVTESRFRTLADSAPILMWVTRTDGKREFANKAYVDFLNVPYQEAIDFDWRRVLHPDDMARILQEQVVGEGSRQLFTLEARYRRYDGEYRWIRSVSQPRWGPDGSFAGFVGVGYDISEAKRAQEDLKRINDLLAERVEAALTERDEAEAALQRAQKLEAVGQLTGGVAHDFNNLLTVVIGALDLMQRHPDDAARRERMIEAAQGAARRGERLTQQLLAFSRRQALKPEPVHVDALLKDAEPLLRRAVGEAVTLIVAPSARDAVVHLDPSQFEAAVMNLVVNARDATPAGGMIRIETLCVDVKDRQIEGLEAGHYLCVAVHDTGAGMDADTIARAFEPFFTTKAPGRGTGLGLSQVYGFARQSGGAATIDSAPAKGSTVCMYLPRIAADPASEAAPAEAAKVQRGPKLKVLLVEDDAQVAELVDAMLGELGHEVIRGEHAEAALAILNAGEPVDLMLTDLIMPGDKSGVELAREAVRLRPRLPIILSSGYTGEVLTAAEHTPWPLLRKPYGPEQLASAIAELTSAKT
ncbi:hybrid sensor histidine kinase/response regulator [Phenylobacterium sp.]|uniref:hybrid sensor histidine kinase/response regulator n=1 Tax=Phenylobacterium sp. TaxID=1871053 RepID=UPI002ED94813